MCENSITEQKLRQQRDDLELLNELMRHDIRNDLQLIQAYSEMLDEHVDEEAQEYLRIIKENTAHAVELTQTVGSLAQVMLRDQAMTGQVSLEPVLARQVEQARTAYPAAAITVEKVCTATTAGDDMLGSVFRNLLQNAIRHNNKTPPEVQVSATRTEDADEVIVRIADNGPGIPDEQKQTVFGKGEKGLNSPGAGLGLYLVQTLVETYGGEVWIEDNDPEGAIFVVSLPVVTDSHTDGV